MRFPTMAMAGRHRPIVPLLVESTSGRRLILDALVDTGSDVTLLPEAVAQALDIELTETAERSVTSALGVAGTYRQMEVILELRRAQGEIYSWKTTVGFLPRRMAYSILGTAGFFEYFTFRYVAPQQLFDVEPWGPLPTR
jgi:hypothetical protein